MLNSVICDLKRYNMIGNATEVTVALSGGADSVALLLCLLEIKEIFGINITAAHLNHCLRGEESDSDEQFVKDLCAGLGVSLTVERADIKSEAEKTHESVELCARRVRYAFLERVSKGLIATAHTANDNTETVLLNLSRGTGISGLCGIPPVRGRIIRPLISVTREQVERFCQEKGVSFRIDSTNQDERYTRNFIRHSIVPRLLRINGGLVEGISNMSAVLRQDAELLDSIAEDSLKKVFDGKSANVDGLCQLHPAIRSRCIANIYEESVKCVPERRHIEAVAELLTKGGRCSVQNDFSAVVKDKKLRFIPSKPIDSIPKTEISILPFSGFGVEITKMLKENFNFTGKFNNLLLINAIDCDKICGKVTLRSRLPQDEIRLFKRNCTKTLKKLFNEAKIDDVARDGIPVLADEAGVVWVSGFGVAERCAVTENTENIWGVRVLNPKSEGK